MPEVYQKHAFYFNPQKLDDIVEKIQQVTNLSAEKRQQLIKAGLHHAQKFSWAVTAKTTLNIYENCLSLRSS